MLPTSPAVTLGSLHWGALRLRAPGALSGPGTRPPRHRAPGLRLLLPAEAVLGERTGATETLIHVCHTASKRGLSSGAGGRVGPPGASRGVPASQGSEPCVPSRKLPSSLGAPRVGHAPRTGTCHGCLPGWRGRGRSAAESTEWSSQETAGTLISHSVASRIRALLQPCVSPVSFFSAWLGRACPQSHLHPPHHSHLGVGRPPW